MNLLYAIWFKCNTKLEAIANYKELEQATKLTKRTLTDALKRLVESGWLKYSKGCTKYSNVYQIQYEKLYSNSTAFLPRTQSEPSQYIDGERVDPITEVGFNSPNYPIVLKEGEDPSFLLSGQYYTYPNSNETYRVVIRDGIRHCLNVKRLTDLERGIDSGEFPKTIINKLSPEHLPY